MTEYKISAKSIAGKSAFAEASGNKIYFDGTAQRDVNLPNPAELLLSALSACILKNIERFSEILKFDYQEASVEVSGIRNDVPPFISEINYVIQIQANMEERTLQLLHKNILKYGTITNTLSKSSKLKGEIRLI